MFWGLAKGEVKSDYEFEHILRDIQTLNEWAMEGKLESTAISVHAFAYVADKYALAATRRFVRLELRAHDRRFESSLAR